MESIFSTKQRVKILKTIIYETESISVNNNEKNNQVSQLWYSGTR